jgi:hypothetical protein
VICSSLPADAPAEEHTSYVATLWPVAGTILSVNRGPTYPKDVLYPMWELARDGLVGAANWERVQIDVLPDQNAPGGTAYIPRMLLD